jgi:hypothetical protein
VSDVVPAQLTGPERQRLNEFVDRNAQMEMFLAMFAEGEPAPAADQVLEPVPQVMVVYAAEVGLGASSLLLRMTHECSLRKLRKAEVVWKDTFVYDYMAVLRKLRDDLGAEHFASFTDLINFYTDPTYQPIGHYQMDINVSVQGSMQVAAGAQISGSSVGDIAGVVLRDNMITVQRPDIAVPDEVRRQQLTQRFLDGLRELSSSGECVVLFFDADDKMAEITRSWMWEQLLPPVRDSLPNVRAVMFGAQKQPEDRDWGEPFLAYTELQPLSIDDIETYITKRSAKLGLDDDTVRELAKMLFAFTKGRPADVAANFDLYAKTNPSSGS